MSVQKVVMHAAPGAEQERQEKEAVRATQSAPRYLCSAVPLPSQVSGRSVPPSRFQVCPRTQPNVRGPRQSAAPASCSSIFNTHICSAVGFAAVRGSARAAATHSPLCPAFHALVWQQQRERVPRAKVLHRGTRAGDINAVTATHLLITRALNQCHSTPVRQSLRRCLAPCIETSWNWAAGKFGRKHSA